MEKRNIIKAAVSLVVGILAFAGFNWLMLPALTFHSVGLWIVIGLTLLVVTVVNLIVDYVTDEYDSSIVTVISGIAFIGIVLIILLGLFFSSRLFNAKKYANVVTVQQGDDITNALPSINDVAQIPLMDTKSAQKMASKKLGELSDVVSQYSLYQDMSQITYQGKPMKVVPLVYDNFFKWKNNNDHGIPGYVMVDPVKNEATYVELEQPMKVSPSACFKYDLKRTLRRACPNVTFDSWYFEIDDNGHPYWIASIEEYHTFLGGREIVQIAVVDAVSAEVMIYDVQNVPEWIDIVFNGDYLTTKINDNGMLQNGFWNSILSQKGCKKTTDDFGYLSIGNDIWMYTGITSAASKSSDDDSSTVDESNIGVIMANERTGEIVYYEIAGADEHSAMTAAEGEVQQMGYEASFPSIVNVNGEPTYVMVLVDKNRIVKSYAMVNVKNYSIMAVEDTLSATTRTYNNKMGTTGNTTENAKDTNIIVTDIQYIVNDGCTTVYIYDDNGHIYRSQWEEVWMTVRIGDKISIYYEESEEPIWNATLK